MSTQNVDHYLRLVLKSLTATYNTKFIFISAQTYPTFYSKVLKALKQAKNEKGFFWKSRYVNRENPCFHQFCQTIFLENKDLQIFWGFLILNSFNYNGKLQRIKKWLIKTKNLFISPLIWWFCWVWRLDNKFNFPDGDVGSWSEMLDMSPADPGPPLLPTQYSFPRLVLKSFFIFHSRKEKYSH